jgi:hypothetical protein
VCTSLRKIHDLLRFETSVSLIPRAALTISNFNYVCVYFNA